MRSSLAVVALAALAALAAVSAAGTAPAPPAPGVPAPGFRAAPPDHRWSFPADWRVHPGFRNEWWYFTGTLEDAGEPGRRLGYQLTFFRVGLAPEAPRLDSAWATADAVMVHAAVTDVATGAHVFSEVLWRAVPLLGGFPAAPEPVVAWAQAAPGTDGRWEVRLEAPGAPPVAAAGREREDRFRVRMRDAARGIALDLELVATKPPALQGPNGLSRKSADEAYASLYVSLTRLATSGTVEVGGRRREVRGESWMDREIGSSQLAPDQVGWDWWSLRLADGRDLMLYVLRRRDGTASWRNATLVDRAGRVRLLAPGDWTVRPIGSWRSEASGATYPSGWELDVPGEGLRLVVTPEVKAAENRSTLVPGLFYWEGPVDVADRGGARVGAGYVELTGYGERARPPI
jgi:predicted secreted hydrolase